MKDYNQVKPGDKVSCVMCGDEFEAVHYSQRYCSDRCRAEKKREIKIKKYFKYRKRDGYTSRGDKSICQYCGKEFTIVNNSNQLYCSSSCLENGTKRNERLRHGIVECSDIITKEIIPVRMNPCKCICCGDDILSVRESKYCSNKCRTKVKSKYTKPKELLYSKKCRCCGKHFKSDSNRSYFCSTECFNDNKKRKQHYKEIPYLVYILGYELNDNTYAIKIGKSTGSNITHRIDSLQSGNPRLIKEYCIKRFGDEISALDFEKQLHDSTIEYITEADNEWRIVDVDILIDLTSFNDSLYMGVGVPSIL